MTVTDVLRKIFKKPLIAVSTFLLKVGFTPNSITLIGLAGTVASAILIAEGIYFYGGLTAAFMGALDAVDGTMARLSGEPGKLGCLFDSLIDRYSESVLLFGFLIDFISAQNTFGIIMVYLALCGSFLVSYIRARAEGLGLAVKIGILTRVERLILLVISLFIGRPLVGAVIIAVLGNLTALQRFWYARSIIKESE